MAGAAATRGFAGFRLLLSPAHERADICDLFATQNLYGLGQGVYPSRALTPWPAHPATLSFVEMVFQDEITDADRLGAESPLSAIQRIAPRFRNVRYFRLPTYFDGGHSCRDDQSIKEEL
jgi:hypothetical protein